MRSATVWAALLLAPARAAMGPLLLDTTALAVGSRGCISEPGESNAVCTDVGVVPDAAACAARCDGPNGTSACSAMTWHGAGTGQWAGHCVLRLDGVFAPVQCGAGCNHTASNHTDGFAPALPAWPPSASGWTGRVKAFWFGANATGLDSDETLALLSRHAVAGYGWQQGGGDRVGSGEERLGEAAAHLLAHLQATGNPNNTAFFVYRQVREAASLLQRVLQGGRRWPSQGRWRGGDPARLCGCGRQAPTGARCAPRGDVCVCRDAGMQGCVGV